MDFQEKKEEKNEYLPTESKKINAKPIVIGIVALLIGGGLTSSYYQNAISDAEDKVGRDEEGVREEVIEATRLEVRAEIVAEVFARTERQLTINDFPEECRPVLQKQSREEELSPQENFIIGHCNTWFNGFNQGKTMVKGDL